MRETPYQTLGGVGEAETRVRASTFIAHAAPAVDEAEARSVLAGRERKHFDATHHCSAWRIHADVWRANDAGEPSGSAGAPILAAIDAVGVEDCVVVVTRYFGGTRLGVGGLVRAYGDAALRALENAPRLTALPAARMRVSYPYHLTSAVMRALDLVAAHEVEHGYVAGGAAGEVLLSIPLADEERLARVLRDQTSGAIAPEHLGERVLYLPAHFA